MVAKSGVRGNPEEAALKALEPYKEEALNLLREAKKAAERLIDEAAESLEKEAASKIKSRAESLRERVAGAKAKAELEVRTKVAAEMNRYAEEVIRRAAEEFKRRKLESEPYKSFLRRALGEVLAEAGERTVKVKAPNEDLELIKSIVEGLGALDRVELEPVEGVIGGFVAEVVGAGLRFDYTLDNILRSEDARLRRVALRALFGRQ